MNEEVKKIPPLLDVLVIDDEVDITEIIKEILSDRFKNIVTCSKPYEALEIVAQNKFKIILSDINMPKLEGYELIRHLRAHGDLTPVIFISGKVNKEGVLSALRLGVSDVIEKPFDSDTLIKSIERVIQIEKRIESYYLNVLKNNTQQIEQQKKMIGLLRVANDLKKSS